MIFGRLIVRARNVRRRKRRKSVSSVQFQIHKRDARTKILARLAYWSTVCAVTHGRVAIRNQSSRWGSCSKKGNLNFNYRIALLPERLMDYVIVHELCHLKEFNHSHNFWNLVAQVMPEYKELRSELREMRITSSVRATAFSF